MRGGGKEPMKKGAVLKGLFNCGWDYSGSGGGGGGPIGGGLADHTTGGDSVARYLATGPQK